MSGGDVPTLAPVPPGDGVLGSGPFVEGDGRPGASGKTYVHIDSGRRQADLAASSAVLMSSEDLSGGQGFDRVVPKSGDDGGDLVWIFAPGRALAGNVGWIVGDGVIGEAGVLYLWLADGAQCPVFTGCEHVLISFGPRRDMPCDARDAVLSVAAMLAASSPRVARVFAHVGSWLRVEWLIGEGDTVRVRMEPEPSVVVQSAYGPASCELPVETPDMGGLCCVPVALVRTPFGGDDGWHGLRWVTLEDLTLIARGVSAVAR